jgi:hypothetical protein
MPRAPRLPRRGAAITALKAAASVAIMLLVNQEWSHSSVRAHLSERDDGLVSVRPMLERAPRFADLLEAEGDGAAFALLRRSELHSSDLDAARQRVLGAGFVAHAPALRRLRQRTRAPDRASVSGPVRIGRARRGASDERGGATSRSIRCGRGWSRVRQHASNKR